MDAGPVRELILEPAFYAIRRAPRELLKEAGGGKRGGQLFECVQIEAGGKVPAKEKRAFSKNKKIAKTIFPTPGADEGSRESKKRSAARRGPPTPRIGRVESVSGGKNEEGAKNGRS